MHLCAQYVGIDGQTRDFPTSVGRDRERYEGDQTPIIEKWCVSHKRLERDGEKREKKEWNCALAILDHHILVVGVG